ncbi:uncharacterized protein CLUP02_15697 [Colletotrichum lupini]|uniref:Uncharacterized protein n=1 Tax=Colletotrichum lupini TaxID=145971 RepID=A0A9Q8T8H5_9PEZI|nr:uncharacterized protein CLUP02_15697 [Colletotrichum lupini]UQC90167.1 hypothetical protein CLUP02_15697 [Colletotrichum lupini]
MPPESQNDAHTSYSLDTVPAAYFPDTFRVSHPSVLCLRRRPVAIPFVCKPSEFHRPSCGQTVPPSHHSNSLKRRLYSCTDTTINARIVLADTATPPPSLPFGPDHSQRAFITLPCDKAGPADCYSAFASAAQSHKPCQTRGTPGIGPHRNEKGRPAQSGHGKRGPRTRTTARHRMPWSMAHGGVDDKHRRAGLESPRPPGPRVGIAPSSKYSVPFFLSLVLVPKFHGAPKTNRRLQSHASLHGVTARQGAFVGRCARAFGHFFDGTASSDRDEEGPEMQQQNCVVLPAIEVLQGHIFRLSLSHANSTASSSTLCRFASPDTIPLHIIKIMLLDVSGMWDSQSTARPGHRAGLEHTTGTLAEGRHGCCFCAMCTKDSAGKSCRLVSGSATFASCSVFAPVASHPARPRPQFSPWSSNPEKVQRHLVPATRQISSTPRPTRPFLRFCPYHQTFSAAKAYCGMPLCLTSGFHCVKELISRCARHKTDVGYRPDTMPLCTVTMPTTRPSRISDAFFTDFRYTSYKHATSASSLFARSLLWVPLFRAGQAPQHSTRKRKQPDVSRTLHRISLASEHSLPVTEEKPNPDFSADIQTGLAAAVDIHTFARLVPTYSSVDENRDIGYRFLIAFSGVSLAAELLGMVFLSGARLAVVLPANLPSAGGSLSTHPRPGACQYISAQRAAWSETQHPTHCTQLCDLKVSLQKQTNVCCSVALSY